MNYCDKMIFNIAFDEIEFDLRLISLECVFDLSSFFFLLFVH